MAGCAVTDAPFIVPYPVAMCLAVCGASGPLTAIFLHDTLTKVRSGALDLRFALLPTLSLLSIYQFLIVAALLSLRGAP